MRLTKEIKDDFVKLVMANLPRQHRTDKVAVKVEAAKLARAALPAELRTMEAKYPGCVAYTSVCLTLIEKGDKLHDNTYYSDTVSIEMPNVVKLKDVDLKDLIAGYRSHVQEERDREEMYKRLMRVANSVTTLARLHELLPELAQWMPAEEAKVYLPATISNVVSDLMKAGLKVKPVLKAVRVAKGKQS
jgi:hypothetical protein